MTRKTSADFAPEVLQHFDAYVHGALSRRGFLVAIAQYATGALTAELILQQLSPQFAAAQHMVSADTLRTEGANRTLANHMCRHTGDVDAVEAPVCQADRDVRLGAAEGGRQHRRLQQPLEPRRAEPEHDLAERDDLHALLILDLSGINRPRP